MARYAVYKVCWGEDFIEHSIRSILPYFDKIFVFWDDRPYGAVQQVDYNGGCIRFPCPMDRSAGIVTALAAKFPQITLQYDDYPVSRGMFQHLVHDRIMPHHPKAECVIFMAADYVWDSEQIELALDEFGTTTPYASSRMVEIWRGFGHYARRTTDRVSCPFWNMYLVKGKLADCAHSTWGEVPNMPPLEAIMHNMGYAVSPQNMFWKYLANIAFSAIIGDSAPDVKWFKDVWLPWDYEKCNTNLEMARTWGHTIPSAEPYDTAKLPGVIQADLEGLKRRTSNATWRGVVCHS